MKAKTKGWIVKIGMAVTGLYATNSVFHILDKIPRILELLTTKIVGEISIITISGAITLYGLYWLTINKL